MQLTIINNVANEKTYKPTEIHDSPGIYQHTSVPDCFIIVAQDKTAISILNTSTTSKQFNGKDRACWGEYRKINSPVTIIP